MRKIIHIDMDCFYAAIEIRENPRLKHQPVAIGGSASQRGVISTANYEARKYGVKSAMSTALALKKCPNLIVLPVRMLLYKAVSQQIKTIFKRYTHQIEPLSLDEAYLDVTDCPLYQNSATRIAKAIRDEIQQRLHLTASAGVAPLKFLAKVASDLNKPNGQYVITPDQMMAFIRQLPLGKIHGVGKVTEQKLNQMGLFTGFDVQNFDQLQLISQLGKQGATLWQRCQGIDDRAIEPKQERKSVGTEQTFIKDMTQFEDCKRAVETLFQALKVRLKKVNANEQIYKQGIKFKFDDFKQTTQEHLYPHLDLEDFVQLAQQVWDQRRNGRKVRLIGLHVILQDAERAKQLSLF